MMKLIPIRVVAERLGLSYGQIECDPILKLIRKDKRNYVLSASVTAYKRNATRRARMPSKVCARGSVSRAFRVFGFSGVLERIST
jgi:hypothetical protein